MLKSLLVANSTLAQLSSRYDFPSRLLAGPSEQWNVRNGEKTRANLFEAYVAGLYASYLKHGDGDVNGKLIGHGNAIGNGHSNGGSAGSGPGPGPGSGLRVPTPPRTPSKRDISTADLRVDDLALDEGTSRNSGRPDVAAEMDDGRAFLHVMGWLKPLFTPIARWALEELEAEQTRIDTRQAELTPDAELDQQSLGASARLNEYFTYKQGGMPEYLPTRSGSDMWTVMCIATMRDGTKQ
jgi:ribonuclease-3